MSIFGTLNVGKQALLAHQRAIEVTSRNIANVNTPGYSRQRPVFEPEPSIRVADGFSVGGGVNVQQVQRLVDRNVEAQILSAKQVASFDQDIETGLTRIEGALDELSGSGNSQALSSFFAALGDLSNDPGDAATRENVLRSLQSLVDQIHGTDQRLEQVQLDANAQIPIDLAEINDLAKSIADVNEQIVRREFGSAEAFSELRDQRQQLLQQLGEKIDFTSFERDDGSLVVFVGGGFVMVDGNSSGELQADTTQPTPLGSPRFFNVYHNVGNTLSGPITDRITGGSLGAALTLRDDRLPFYRQQLDSFAFTFATALNTAHLAGAGLDDGSARNLIVDPDLPGANPPGVPPDSILGAARRIAINPDVASNSRHLAAGLPVAGGPASSGDNTNALALAALREQATQFFQVGDPVAGPPTGVTQTLPSFFANLSGVLGAEIRSTRIAVQRNDLLQGELDDRRATVSGVSIDEEVADLVRFQRGFEASARIITVADKLLETLLNI